VPVQLLYRNLIWGVAAGAVVLGACNRNDQPDAPPPTTASPEHAPPTERVVGPLTPAEAAALGTMNDRLKQYVDLHLDVEKGLPKVPNDATPQQIDARQRELQRRMAEARASAKPGDLFTPEARPVILRLLKTVFSGPEGRQLKASVMDENPTDLARYRLAVNARYPDNVPVTTVPVDVLQTLPALTEDLEYRFIGDALILLDVHAHTIADYIEHAIPS